MVFLIWGLWWAWNVLRQHAQARGSHKRYAGNTRSWYKFPSCGLWGAQYLEILLKVFGVASMVFMELRGDHDRYL